MLRSFELENQKNKNPELYANIVSFVAVGFD